VALELFAERGYEKTSLREIAGRLGVTKAALYYHFKSKEDIVRSFTEDYVTDLDELIAWGTAQPRTDETRGLLLDRYSVIVGHRLPVMRFLEQNQAAVHQLVSEGQRDRHQVFRTQFERLRDLLAGPDAPLRDRVRASVAVVSVGISCLLFDQDAGAPGELHDIALETACELAGVARPAG
jgi:AcrR family transcriptional regulator